MSRQGGTNVPAKVVDDKKAAPKPLGLTLVQMGHQQFAELIALEYPAHLAPQALARFELGIRQRMFRTPELQNCDPGQLVSALVEACQWGFETSPVLGHFSIVPYGRDCQLIPSRKGLAHAAMRSGQVERIEFGVLHRCDAERMEKQGIPLFLPQWTNPVSGEIEIHRPNIQTEQLIDDDRDRSDAQIVGAWCAVKLNGDPEWRKLYMRRSEIEKHRAASKSPNGPGWKNWYADMGIKTVSKKLMLSGRIPMGTIGRMLAEGAEDLHEEIVRTQAEVVASDAIDAEIEDIPDHDALAQEAMYDEPYPGERDALLEELAHIEDEQSLDPKRVAEYSIRKFGRDPNELAPVLLAQLIGDVSEGKVR